MAFTSNSVMRGITFHTVHLYRIIVICKKKKSVDGLRNFFFLNQLLAPRLISTVNFNLFIQFTVDGIWIS